MAFLARWLTWDAAKAVFWGVSLTALLAGLAILYRDIKGGATAEARLECSQTIAAASASEQQTADALNAAGESAAQRFRDLHRNDGGKTTKRALAVQNELQSLAKDGDPVCFPKGLAKALGQ